MPERQAIKDEATVAVELPSSPHCSSASSVGLIVPKSDWKASRFAAGACRNADGQGEPIPTLPIRCQPLYLSATPSVEKIVKPFILSADSTLAGGTDPATGGFTDLTGSDFLWNVTNGSRLDDGRVCHEMVDKFAPSKFFASVRGIEHDQLFTKFNVGAARQMYLSAEVRMRVEYNVKERRRLKSVIDEKEGLLKVREEEIERSEVTSCMLEKDAEPRCHSSQCRNFYFFASVHGIEHDQLFTKFNVGAARQMYLSAEVRMRVEYNVKERRRLKSVIDEKEGLLKVREEEIESLKSQLLLKEAEAAEAIRLSVETSMFEAVEKSLQDEVKALKERNTTLEKEKNDLMFMSWRLLLPYSKKKSRYGPSLGREILPSSLNHYFQPQMAFDPRWLSAGITHGKEGRTLTDVAAHNPSVKDASIEAVMNILHLEEPLANKLGLSELQPHIDQLMVPIHHSLDKVIIGATALSLALDVSNIRVWKIRESISNQRSALRDVFIPLAEPFSTAALTGMEGTSDTVTFTADTTIALSTTFVSASTIAPISIDDYEVIGTDDQAADNENAEPFPNVDAELNIP
ncbi:hypothetical protein Tco_0891578 [Tanacetum coccineum]|uniref:Uncharacterized protein n=1 Tax=Tanacetum coccineum TaxID=301880 RepID=A0ABQ5C3N4_9ASTR